MRSSLLHALPRAMNVLPALAALLLALCSPATQAQAPTTPQHAAWWQHAVLYEIYPRSFQDSNGDGLGDLNGITERLPYLEHLGVDAIWIAPMYPSPQVDFGYDISNYEAVDPQYGTLADMDRLIADARRRHMRVLLDMVLNHTSDRHPWFVAAASARTNPKHDWYVWNDGLPENAPGVTAYQHRFAHDGRVPPNNWESLFGGSAWQWVPAVHQFYYHRFYKQQPDLNWSNPAVEKAAFDAMRFWLDRGIAGFRLDAITALFEDPQLRDDPPAAGGGLNAQGDPALTYIHTDNLPEVHGVIRRMRAMVDAYPGDRVLVGETYLATTADLAPWYGAAAGRELNLPMDMLLGFHGNHDALNAVTLRTHVLEAETELHGQQPLFVFDNHDNVRSIDRYAPPGASPAERAAIAKVLASILLTSRATVLLYQGEELGQSTTTPTRKEDVKDPIGITGWPQEKGRDGERTPMPWTPGPQAGFTTNPHPWLPIPPSAAQINVQTEQADPASQLTWYTRLIALRRTNPALRDGSMRMLDETNPSVLSWLRTSSAGGPAVLVAMNCTGQPQTVSLDPHTVGADGSHVRTLLTDDPALEHAPAALSMTLAPYATWIGELDR